MKKILFLHPSAAVFFYSKDRDDCNVPYILLREAFEKQGYEFHIAVKGDLKDYEFIFCIDLFDDSFIGQLKRIRKKNQNYDILSNAIKEGLSNKIVIFLSESFAIAPFNYNSRSHKNIGTFFTWQKKLLDNKKYFHFYLPVRDRVEFHKNIDFDKKKLVMSISGNKFSSNKGELYSYRRKSVKYLDKELPNEFDLYGVGWNDNGLMSNIKRFIRCGQFDFTKYQTYRGSPFNKSEVISGYKYSICYENAIYDDYITEKIFDIFINESVPVFYGASNISNYIPENTFINRENFNSDHDLICYLNTIDKSQYMEFIYNINLFLDSDEFHKFGSIYFIKNIMNTLGITKYE